MNDVTQIVLMKNARPYLSSELWPGILCYLPVKSLLRFRCVSTSWLSLIKDPEFARLHLKNFKNNLEETHLLAVHNGLQDVVVRSGDTLEINSETLFALGRPWCKGSWDFVCSFDGLVLLKSFPRNSASGFYDLKLWNPSIRKFHQFPSLPAIEAPPGSNLADEEIGLGYDSVSNDYKHLKLIFSEGTAHSVAIYSLRTGSWKINKFQGKGCSGNWRLMFFELGRMVYLRGSLYFLVWDTDHYPASELISFDLSSETFSSIELPDAPGSSSYDFQGWTELVLIDGGRSLAVLDISSDEKSVLVLASSRDESESMCWTKRYSFHLKYNHRFLYVKKNGDILTQRNRQETVKYETGKKSVMWDRVASYSLETDEYKILWERKGSTYLVSRVRAYVESLVLL